jgi:hypothetical protein
MKKLLKLKQYLSLHDSAKYLSAALEEPVSVADIYELSLEGHLAISTRFINQAYAKEVTLITEQDFLDGQHQVDELDEQVHIINGIHELAMIGEEKFEIRKRYQLEIKGDSPVLSELNGFFVKKEDCIYKLLESLPVSTPDELQRSKEAILDSLLKSKGLTSLSQLDEPLTAFEDFDVEETLLLARLISPYPEDEFRKPISFPKSTYQLVVRSRELHRFVNAIDNTPSPGGKAENTLLPLEKRTLLNFVHILLKGLDIDPSVRGVSSSLRLLSDKAGIPISDNTIRKVLKDVVEYSD